MLGHPDDRAGRPLLISARYLAADYRPWDPAAWTSSDDRVRGGKSQSYLECPTDDTSKAIFHGNLDITALGGAGFASQRTADTQSWDLSAYDALLVGLGQSDAKRYTLTLKDKVLPKRPDGREQSTVSWEYDFTTTHQGPHEQLRIAFGDLKPTYRGKSKPDATPLDLKNVKRISVMMRRSVSPNGASHSPRACVGINPTIGSFFGDQQGPFRLEIEYIAACAGEAAPADEPHSGLSNTTHVSTGHHMGEQGGNAAVQSSWLDALWGIFRR
jgi:hypothetical protein